MARPRVFVSSTYYDLKHIRASLEVFIDSLGYDAVLFEKGDIAFHPDMALDESCYREAANADIFVLIIGGRYGSPASDSGDQNQVASIYQSVTKKEFQSAQTEDVPTFILLDSAVAAEYRTYLKNRENASIKYAHVDSIGVFKLLDDVFELSRNNPVFNFDRATQIESWLREQWAGLFRELLRSRSQQGQLAALNAQVAELKSVNSSLKTYMEAVLTTINPGQSNEIIRDQEDKLARARSDIQLEVNPFYVYLKNRYGLDDDQAREVITSPVDADDVVRTIERHLPEGPPGSVEGSVIRRALGAQRDYNRARALVDLEPIDFSASTFPDVATTAVRRKKIKLESDSAGGS